MQACEPGPSRLASNPLVPLSIKHACHLEQPDASSWFSAHDKESNASHLSSADVGAGNAVADRYAEALWLGEFHTSLSHFLNCIERVKTSYDLEDIVLGLCHLVKSNSAISRRHRAAASRLLRSADKQARNDLNDEFRNPSEYEQSLVLRAIERAGYVSGSTQAMSPDSDALSERWASSMESREIQLQILVTMCLLQMISQEPRALDIARARLGGDSSTSSNVDNSATTASANSAVDNDGGQVRKRSRKLEKAKRWRGARPNADANEAFAWNQQPKRLATDSSHDDGEHGEGEVLEVDGADVLAVDHLSKRLEALVDILCLRQVASEVGSEIADLLSDIKTETSDDQSGVGRNKSKGELFGTSVRKLVEDDDLDDAQWLCSHVVEPHFESSLPRQCSLFRSKCFVSLQSRTPARTPARPTKSARTGSLSSPPMRAPKRSAGAASTGPSTPLLGAGLSDVLEKEQAGRRVKRNIMAERTSMLGRGREVDMGRRLSRSISANLGIGRDSQASIGVFSRSNTSMTMSQPKFEANTSMESQALGTAFRRSASQRLDSAASMRSSTFSARSSFAASPPTTTSKRLLVMSTPQKDSTSKALDVKHFTGLDKPKLVFPSLVMESPT